jgi:hypothetical protein
MRRPPRAAQEPAGGPLAGTAAAPGRSGVWVRGRPSLLASCSYLPRSAPVAPPPSLCRRKRLDVAFCDSDTRRGTVRWSSNYGCKIGRCAGRTDCRAPGRRRAEGGDYGLTPAGEQRLVRPASMWRRRAARGAASRAGAPRDRSLISLDWRCSRIAARNHGERVAGPGAHSCRRGCSRPEWRMTMHRILRFAVPCGLGLAVLLNLPVGLAAAPGSQEAPPAAAVGLSAVPSPPPEAAETFAAGSPQSVRRVAGREAETPPSLDEFLVSLSGGQPQPASSCSAMTTCLCGGVVSCSGSTCSKGVGCFVVCDGVEHDCSGCSRHPCA